MNTSYLRGIYLRLAGVLMLVVAAALAASAYISHHTFDRALAPEMGKNVAAIGGSLRALILKAVENNVDFRELYGVEQKFDEIKRETPEVSYFAITDVHGNVLHQRLRAPAGALEHFRSAPMLARLGTPDAPPAAVRVGDQYIVSLPIVGRDGPLGLLHIGVDVRFIDDIVLGMLYDVLVVLVVALFFTLELLNFMAGARLEEALRTLGDTFERGAAGNFARPARTKAEGPFAPLLKLMDGVLAHVNEAYAALARDVEAARGKPAHERPPGVGAAQAGLQTLTARYRFGSEAPAAPGADNTQLAKVRAPLFVFILAEELTRSFLPTYVKGLLVPIPGLAPELVVGLPIALFMLIVAIGQPWLGVYCERVGHRRTMLTGAGIATVGFLATAMSYNVLDLLLWRSLCAVGYAMVFVAGQAYVLEHSTLANRARSFALFVGAIMVATVCGPSIGGILADNIGERATFVVAAVLALGSTAAMRMLPERRASAEPRAVPKVPSLREIGALMINRRFMTVTGLAAIPAKVLLTGVAFYLVPLYIVSIGSTQAMAGRILMCYAVMMVVLAPLTAALAKTRERMEWLVGAGLVISGLGGLALLAGDGVGWVFAAVLLIGAGQSLSISAQSALVGEHCREEVARIGEGTVYGVYRLLERMGNAAGPLLAGVLVLRYGYRSSFVAIGAFVLLSGLAFVIATRRSRGLAVAAA